MIPLKLTLYNFMCYRDHTPAINFESIHTACISGNNGNGKSALIDAITWALWGQTRAASDDELVYSGQSEAMVEFEFAVGEQRYRIIRRRSKPKTQKSSGQTILEFQVETPEGYKVLTGDNTTLTQQKIIQVLHMDYDTFINSAFLRQGRADEFTKKRPNERKQILGNILQLSFYDELEESAKEQAKQQENLISQIESTLSGIKEELIHKAEYQSGFDQAQNELKEIENKLQEQQKLLNQLREDKKALENKSSQLSELTAHIQDFEKNHRLWQEQMVQIQSRIKTYDALISQKEILENNFSQFLEFRKKNQELEQKQKLLNSLIQSKHRLELSLMKAGEELNRTHAVTQNHINELEKTAGNLNRVQEELQRVVLQLKNIDEEENLLREKREQTRTLHARLHHLESEGTRLKIEIEQIEEKIKMLSLQQGANCPLCESELGVDGQKRIETKYKADKTARFEDLNSNQIEAKSKEVEAKKLDLEIQNLEVRIKQEREINQSRYGNLNKARSDALEAVQKITGEKAVLEELEQRMARRDFALAEQEALTGIEKEIAQIGYNPQEHDLVRSRLTALEKSEVPKRKLEEAERLIQQEKESALKAQVTLEELQQKIETGKQRRLALLAELTQTTRVAGDLMLAESEYQNILSKQKHLQEICGGAKAKLERLAELELKNREKEIQLGEAKNQEKIFKDLSQAFGKKGVQAMLIEMAIPEIETEANLLLSRMTDNRMHLKLETQRETKKGDVMETLDINISDELGTRNYEMFSGGEAFRIDFAIRIALAKLLARRAGAPLPTLIIDEGFGTQDTTGIEKIKEAITSIQDDFEKILVITHIADFKDAFPMRIEVVKGPDGSSIYLS